MTHKSPGRRQGDNHRQDSQATVDCRGVGRVRRSTRAVVAVIRRIQGYSTCNVAAFGSLLRWRMLMSMVFLADKFDIQEYDNGRQ